MRHKLIQIVSKKLCRKGLSGGAVVLLSLLQGQLSPCRAQLEYNGGFVQTRREDHGEILPLLPPGRTAPSAVHTSYYVPDLDFSYPRYDGPTAPLLRSYYSYYPARDPRRAPPTAEFGLPSTISAQSLPWNRVGFKDYDGIQRKYGLAATALGQPSQTGAQAVVLVAHLPEHALFWVEGTRTRSTGRTRYFQSPTLLPGRKYNYQVRAAWIENGQWVSQTRSLLVQAGLTQAIYLQAK